MSTGEKIGVAAIFAVWALFFASFWGGIAYVVLHFLAKWW